MGVGRGKLPWVLQRPRLLRRLRLLRRQGVRAVFTAFPVGAFIPLFIAHEIYTVRLHVALPGFYLKDNIVGLALRGQSH